MTTQEQLAAAAMCFAHIEYVTRMNERHRVYYPFWLYL
jgi:hypothetical protein